MTTQSTVSQNWSRKPFGSFDNLPTIAHKTEFAHRLQKLDLRKRLIAIRNHYNLTCVDMAKLLGRGVQQLQRYECGDAPINYAVRQKLMKLTGLTENYFKDVFTLKQPHYDKKSIAFLMSFETPHQRLRIWREKYYLGTQAELAQELGICAYYLIRMEKGSYKITMRVADTLAEFAELPISVFFDG